MSIPVQASGWHAALAGALLGLSLAAPPGPVTAIMVSASLHGRVRQAFVTACGAISADLCWLLLSVVGVLTIFHDHPRWLGCLGLAGAALLLWMAWGAWLSARRGIRDSHTSGSWKLGFFTVLTSPISLAWWLANGALLYTSWGLPGILGLFPSLVIYSALFCIAFRWLGSRAARAALGMAYASILVLVGFGLYVGYTSVRLIGAL
ncbi:MAG TPA: LysE family transporter [Gammaproteobacteria bacterium]|jgi:threonine/homoserine/homoserine lactone efflux protein